MTKRLLFYFAAFSFLAWGLGSCAPVDELSDANSISSVKVGWQSNQEIVLGTPELGDSQITIPVLYGSGRFPLTVRLDIAFKSDIDKVIGQEDIFGDLTFVVDEAGAFESKEFYVQSLSGLPRKYTVTFRETDYSVAQQIPLSVMGVSPDNSAVFGRASVKEDEVHIYVVEPQFPLSITPLFVDDRLGFSGFDNGSTGFRFESAEDFHEIIITDKEKNSSRDFKLFITPLALVTGDGNYESTDIYNGDFTANLTAGNSFGLKGFRIENTRDSISVYVTQPAEAEFPFTMTAGIEVSSGNTGFIGFENGQEIVFDSLDETFAFYYADIDTKVARHWRITPVLYKELGRAEVEAMTYSYTAAKVLVDWSLKDCITLDKSNIDIFPQSREILLRATAINSPLLVTWKLTLSNVALTLSEGAQIDQSRLPNLVYNGNDSWKESRSYYIIPAGGLAEDAVEWTLKIRDYRSFVPSGEAAITGVSLRSLMPLMAKADELTPATVDAGNNEISINIIEDEGCYPMEAVLDYELSPFAQVTSQNGGADPLVFAAATAVNSVTVLAEDGVTSSEWSVRLNVQKKSTGANVSNFAVNSFSSPLTKVSNVETDNESATVEISLSKAGSFPSDVNYKMTLSRGATADIPLEGTLRFANLNDTKRFTVSSSSGETKEWTVKFAPFTPQLDNWNMDSWADENTPRPAGSKASPYWSTSNNAATTLVGRTTGVTGYAASLTSKSIIFVGLASGSLFTGWFDKDNAMSATSDPVKITFQGIEWAASKKIVALEVDVNYTSGGTDTGSIAIEFIKQAVYNPSTYVFHGNRPNGTAHPDNTAVSYLRKNAIVGNSAASGVTDVVAAGQWKTVRLAVDYGSLDPFGYTHLLVIFSSSSDGDNYNGDAGSKLLVDNIKLIYEE